ELPIVFASLFWVGMFWRRATKWAAWGTVLFSVLAFFLLPWLLPRFIMPGLDENPKYAVANDIVTTVVTRQVAYADVKRREAAIELWEKQGTEAIGARPEVLELGATIDDPIVTGGKAVFWSGGVEPIGEKKLRDLPGAAGDEQAANIKVTRQQYDCPLRGKGQFRVDFLIYDRMGLDMTKMSNAALETLRLPTRVILPFVVMILLSLITPRVGKDGLDRFYVKMKTPVNPDPEADQRELAVSYEDPSRFDHKRLVSRFGLEMQRPNREDVVGFVVCFIICFALIGLTVWLARIGS
ncbi:hypothetical protein ACFL5Q_07265, partial [Planctomycetota bacterium]